MVLIGFELLRRHYVTGDGDFVNECRKLVCDSHGMGPWGRFAILAGEEAVWTLFWTISHNVVSVEICDSCSGPATQSVHGVAKVRRCNDLFTAWEVI